MLQSWQTIYLGLQELPREISTFELQSFFTYSRAERELFHARRGNAHKLGLALHRGFLRLSGRMLNSVRIVPATLWQHLGNDIGITRGIVFQSPSITQPPQFCIDGLLQLRGLGDLGGAHLCARFAFLILIPFPVEMDVLSGGGWIDAVVIGRGI